MEAARVAARRGHHVVLFEKGSQLGGALVMASAPVFKEDMRRYLDWSRRTMMKTPNIDLRLRTEATPEAIKAESPDVLIVAVGAIPFAPPMPGVDGKNVAWVGDVNLGTAAVGETIVVAGAGLTGCECALHLALAGKKVSVIDMLPLDEIAADAPALNVAALRNILRDHHVDVREEVRLEAVTEAGAVIIDKDGDRGEIRCDTVVLALGVCSRPDLLRTLEHLAPEMYVVGDCGRERGNLWYATTDGFDAAMSI